jgi:hypothetical protein
MMHTEQQQHSTKGKLTTASAAWPANKRTSAVMAKFKPGKSGNPSGRAQGSKNRATKLLEAIEKDTPALLAVTKEKALGGDMTAMRLLLERALPVRKPVAPTVNLPELGQDLSLTSKAQAVIAGVGKGMIPPDIASQLITAIGATAKVVEIDELERRITQLERGANEHN